MEHSRSYDHNLSNKMVKQEMHFPIDVMINILNRLPSTSILRFQTVSKYWCYVIRVSDILNARSKSSLTSVQLCTNAFGRKLVLFNFDVDGKTNEEVPRINLGSTSSYHFSNIVNGLACAYGRKTTTNFYLINLTTFKTSYYSKRKIKGITIDYDQITLGLDPTAGLYKFIRIYSHNKTSSYHCEILEIGVLFKGNWKIVGEIPHKVDLENPVFLNGAIYWKMNPFWASSSLNKRKALAFDLLKLDMKEEKFETVTPVLQDEVDRCNYQLCHWDYSFTLSEEKGKLYMLHYCCERKYLYGWRLKESEGGCVWNIVFHVDFASVAEKEAGCLLCRRECPYAVGIVDGKVMICCRKSGTGACIYDLVHKKLTKHRDVRGGFAFEKHCKRRIMLFTSARHE